MPPLADDTDRACCVDPNQPLAPLAHDPQQPGIALVGALRHARETSSEARHQPVGICLGQSGIPALRSPHGAPTRWRTRVAASQQLIGLAAVALLRSAVWSAAPPAERTEAAAS